MAVIIISGAGGLVGSETARFFQARGFDVVGLDNDLRAYFFGGEASTRFVRERLRAQLSSYVHESIDVRDGARVESVFRRYNRDIAVVVHAAAQPSHDWAAHEPHIDFSVNAVGTLNMLEAARRHCPEAVFMFTSTNKVYGDRPNELPFVERETRWELPTNHRYFLGIDETMSIDQSTHSLMGVSKASADLLVQEYGRYFGMRTGVLRCGCLTGPAHAGAEQHGFLAYLMKCVVTGRRYQIFGYGGKQVRDNLHAQELVRALWEFFQNPRCGEVYNLGGGRHANCSVLEAIELCESIAGKRLNWSYCEKPRTGDHIWWISDVSKFQRHYPAWSYEYDLRRTLEEIHDACLARQRANAVERAVAV